MNRPPWEVEPAMTEERLGLIARKINEVRDEVFDTQEPSKGDGPWIFGCRSYGRTCFALSRMAETTCIDWLRVEAEKLSCTLRIGGVALKFYRGESDDPTPRALRGGASVALRDATTGQGQLYAELDRTPDDAWFWLMAIETHGDGTVSRVTVLQATEEGHVRNQWDVPLTEPVRALADVSGMQREAVELDPPVVGPKAPEQDISDNTKTAGDGLVEPKR